MHHINGRKGKKFSSTYVEKAFAKIRHLLRIKTFSTLGKNKIIKIMYEKLSLILYGEILKAFPQQSGERLGYWL